MTRMHGLPSLVLVAALAVTGDAAAQGFKFSDDDKARAEEKAAQRERVEMQISTMCSERIRNRKIMVVIGEEANGMIQAQQAAYGAHFDAINGRLQGLGLRTYTQEEIRRQIRQAEIDAYMRNDPEAARSAAKRLGASYTLKGLISTDTRRNPMIGVNEVAVSMRFVLTAADGRRISEAEARSRSFSGSDVRGMALTLVNENAQEVVAKLYADYCSQPERRK